MTEGRPTGTLLEMRRLLFALAVATLLVTPVRASVAVAYDLVALVGRSEQVIAGTVVESQGRYDGPRIVTDVLVEVESVGKGRARPGDTVELITLGGSVGEVTMRVEGSVRPRRGDRAVFFLERRGGHLLPTGMSQGVLPIVEGAGGAVVRSSVPGLELVQRTPDGRVVPAPPAVESDLPLATVLERVRALVGGAR